MLCIAYVIRNIVYLKKNPIVFHDGFNLDDHIIIKDLAEDFENNLLVSRRKY